MAPSRATLAEQLELADTLREGRERMFEPQDLPGRYGRVIQAIDHVLRALHCEAVVAGGWAVWRHGYVARVTQDVDIVIPAARLEEFLRVAPVSGFQTLKVPSGRWPKLLHKETGIQVDLLPEGGRPGVPGRLAPTTIPHPSLLGAPPGAEGTLRYIHLPALIELKLAAGRGRDEADAIELLRVNPDAREAIRTHLAGRHPAYAAAFDRLLERALEEE